MSSVKRCPRCGATLVGDGPAGRCPACLIELAVSGEEKDAIFTSAPITEGPGAFIDRYELLEQIGEGGFGVVYVAEQREPIKRRVALKVIKLGMDTRQVVARFEAERQALALMDHPHIAKVLDGGATETGRPYFVMELVRGIKITDYCEQKNLSISERLELFRQVCQATQHAHQKGIIHRDLKPSNILVTLQEGKAVPKMIDFGIAKTTQQELTEKTVYTRSQHFLGTPAYISPEQAEWSGLDIDTRSDIYSLGVLLYELLTGATPFDTHELLNAGIDEMRRTLREREPVRPSTRLHTLQGKELTTTTRCRRIEMPKLISVVRGDLDCIVMKCLEKDRTRRYETANGLALDVERFLKNEPVLARPPSATYRLRKLIRRNRLGFAAAAMVAAALVLGGVLTGWQAVRARRAEKRAEKQAERADAEASRARQAERAANEKSFAAEAQREAIRLISYVDAMNVAQRYCAENNFAQAMSLLQTPQLRGGKSDLRGFEWRYLYALCRGNYSRALPKHEQVLGTMEFSPDGRLLATYCWDRKLRLWDLAKPSREPLRLIPNVTGLGGFSADGTDLVFGSIDGSVQRFQWSAGTITNALQGAGEIVAFSAGENVAVTIFEERQIKIWDLATGRLRFSLPGRRRYLEFGWVDPAAISPDGKLLAVIESAEGPDAPDAGIHLWDLRTGRESAFLKDDRQIRVLKFSPDSARLAVGDGQGRVKLWELAGGEATIIQAHPMSVFSLAFSPNGRTLASGSSDETIKFWDTKTGLAKSVSLRGHGGAVHSLAFADDTHLASGSRGSPVKIWDLEQPDLLNEITGLHTKGYGNFAFSPNGKSMAAGCNNETVVVWDVDTLHINCVLTNLQYVVAFTKSSDHLLASTRQEIGYWCDLARKTRRRLPSHDGSLKQVHSVDLSPDHIAALGYANGIIELWDVETGKPCGSINAHDGWIRALSFSPDGARLVSGGSDRAIRIWDVKRQVKLGETSEQHKGAICAAVLSHEGSRLASGCGAGTIKLWNPSDLTTSLITIPCHKSALHALDFSYDRKTLASGSEDKTVKLWNVDSLLSNSPAQREVASFRLADTVRLAQFSLDDNALAVVTDDGVLHLYRATPLSEADSEIEALKP